MSFPRPPRPDPAARLAWLREEPSLDALAHVLRLLVPRGRWKDDAARAVDAFLSGVGPDGLPALDEELSRWTWTMGDLWPLRPGDVARLDPPPGTEAGVLGMATFHRNGWVRHVAVRALAAEVREGSGLPYLLVRVNDWVPAIRADAEALVRERLRPDFAPALVASLGLVLRLRGGGRADHGAFVRDVLDLLSSPECRDAVRAGIDAPAAAVRRACWGLALRSAGGDLPALLARGASHADPVLRRETLCAAVAASPDVLVALLPTFLADPLSPIRRDALRLLAERSPGEARERAEAALLDRSPMTREKAREILSDRGREGFAGVYRSALAEDRSTTVALAGLSETGTRGDAPAVAAFLTHGRASVRLAALRSLARLDAEAAFDPLVQALADPAPSVATTAGRLLAPRAARVGESHLGALFRDDPRPHVRRTALALLARSSKWVAAPWIVEACADPDPFLSAIALDMVRRWVRGFNRSHVAPTAQQSARLLEAVDGAGESIDAHTRRYLRFVAGPA